MSRETDVQYEEDNAKNVEFILENKAGWTMFTNWYTQQRGVGHTKANRAWKKALKTISEQFADDIKSNVNETMIELENLKQRAIEAGDRRIELEAMKYQSKIKGNEVERVEVKTEGNIVLSWGETTK
jgi:acetyl/propionyl-CoA carboxylase alpha subunit